MQTLSPHWQPSASIATLKQRAQLMAALRAFFYKRNYLEVETPLLGSYGVTDPYLDNIHATFRKQTYYLQTSPEYHMKRLLAAGSGPIFQLARVFRDDELGRWHNPEFTLLEWYQLDYDHHAMMDEVEALLQLILATTQPMLRQTYQETFSAICDIDPFATNIAQLKHSLQRFQLEQVLHPEENDPDLYLFLLMTHVVEPQLAKLKAPIAIYNYPPSQASLAKIHQGVAERFEIYYQGIELANGFHELTDSVTQNARFQADLIMRQNKGLALPEPDKYLLQALAHGLPACSGVALGIERLLALALGHSNISQTLAFDFHHA